MAGRRTRAEGRPPRARAAAVTAPRGGATRAAELRRFAPSRRSLVFGCGLVAIAFGGYYAARESAAFAVRRVEVRGAPPDVRAQVRRTVGPFLGVSLLALDGAALERRLESLPTVVSASYDRAFPHTLRLRVVPETPVAVLRRGPELWLVSARGRVIARIPKGSNGALARIWVKRAVPVAAGGFLATDAGGASARALALAARFPARVKAVSLSRGSLVFRLRSGLELRLGEPTDIRLKLAIARRALTQLPAGSAYLDVSVPGRPVAGANPQLSSGG
jgi:cell division protein FtsQ